MGLFWSSKVECDKCEKEKDSSKVIKTPCCKSSLCKKCLNKSRIPKDEDTNFSGLEADFKCPLCGEEFIEIPGLFGTSYEEGI